jgi:hypothetical protein
MPLKMVLVRSNSIALIGAVNNGAAQYKSCPLRFCPLQGRPEGGISQGTGPARKYMLNMCFHVYAVGTYQSQVFSRLTAVTRQVARMHTR